jgi:hypothetical protein
MGQAWIEAAAPLAVATLVAERYKARYRSNRGNDLKRECRRKHSEMGSRNCTV